MARQTNAAPVIIKRKKVVQRSGHHGGAWKVAYADFVTAMMAFFMLMWLLNATTQDQRKGLADFFRPDVPITAISGGGDGALAGDSALASDIMAFDGTEIASGLSDTGAGPSAGDLAAIQAEVEAQLARIAAENPALAAALRQIMMRMTDEGLVIELFDLADSPLFGPGNADPMPVLRELADILADVLPLTANRIAVAGHVRAHPITLIDNRAWPLSAGRAETVRTLLETAGLAPSRFQRVTGFADRKPVVSLPQAVRNNRIEITLLIGDRRDGRNLSD